MLADGAGDRVAEAAGLGVEPAHDALQHGELDDDLADEVGLREPGGGAEGLGHGVAGAVARRAPGPAGQRRDEAAEAAGLVGQRAELLVEHDGAQALRHGGEALGEVAVVGELGVVEAAVEHALVAARDERRRRGGAVGDVEERRQQLAGGVRDREVALVTLHGGDEDLGRQPQVPLLEAAARHARPLGEVDRLGQHVARVGPLAAELRRGGVEAGDDAAAALGLRDDDLLVLEQALVVAGVRRP